LRCEEFDELIYLLWDGPMDERKKEELEKHLSTCNRCKEKLALLESIEKRAKGTKIKEPSPEYWDTFSTRVRERIIAQEEKPFSFKLKKIFENIFTFSPLKIKIAAGVVSIIFVFIVGKLYVDYRGKEIVPILPRTESKEKPALYAPKPEKKIAPPVDLKDKAKAKEVVIPQEAKVGKKEAVVLPKEELKSEGVPALEPEGKGEKISTQAELHKIGVPPEEKVKKEEKPAPPTIKLEQAPASKIIPQEESEVPTAYSAGAGAEEKGETLHMVVQPEHKVMDVEGVPLKETTKTVERKILSVALERAIEAPPTKNYYFLQGEEVLQIKEEDTLLHADTLKKIIESWNGYIEKNPKDSLTNQGYLQMAIGYYLLSKLTQDQSVLSKGIELLEKYEKQITDPKTKEELNKKLKELKALKEK